MLGRMAIRPQIPVSVRRGAVRDAACISDIFRESWRQAYRGVIPHLQLEAMLARRDAVWWRRSLSGRNNTLVLQFEDHIVGYTNFGRARSKGPYGGEIYELYLAPIYQGLGFGEYLFEGARHALDMRGLAGLVVWAISENQQACEFYRRRGGRPVATTTERFGGVRVQKTAFGWRDDIA
jgi:ribosomal protein S18 acetylase RimI-like enzyme